MLVFWRVIIAALCDLTLKDRFFSLWELSLKMADPIKSSRIRSYNLTVKLPTEVSEFAS